MKQLHKDNEDFYIDNRLLLGLKEKLEKNVNDLNSEMIHIRNEVNHLRNENNDLRVQLDAERNKPVREVEVIKKVELPPQIVYKSDEATLNELKMVRDEISILKPRLAQVEDLKRQSELALQDLESKHKQVLAGLPRTEVVYKQDENLLRDLKSAHDELNHLRPKISSLEQQKRVAEARIGDFERNAANLPSSFMKLTSTPDQKLGNSMRLTNAMFDSLSLENQKLKDELVKLQSALSRQTIQPLSLKIDDIDQSRRSSSIRQNSRLIGQNDNKIIGGITQAPLTTQAITKSISPVQQHGQHILGSQQQGTTVISGNLQQPSLTQSVSPVQHHLPLANVTHQQSYKEPQTQQPVSQQQSHTSHKEPEQPVFLEPLQWIQHPSGIGEETHDIYNAGSDTTSQITPMTTDRKPLQQFMQNKPNVGNPTAESSFRSKSPFINMTSQQSQFKDQRPMSKSPIPAKHSRVVYEIKPDGTRLIREQTSTIIEEPQPWQSQNSGPFQFYQKPIDSSGRLVVSTQMGGQSFPILESKVLHGSNLNQNLTSSTGQDPMIYSQW